MEHLTFPTGARLGFQVNVDQHTGVCVVTALQPGGPSERMGLEVGMVLVRVDGVGIVGLEDQEVLHLIRTPQAR